MLEIFSPLQSHLHFFVHFFYTFMEYFFFGHPISNEQFYLIKHRNGFWFHDITAEKQFLLLIPLLLLTLNIENDSQFIGVA